MGCDIHLAVESRRYDKWWSNLTDVWTPRNYVLFGHMAEGVRYDTDDAFSQRGFPDDADWGTKEKYYLALDTLTEDNIERYKSFGCKIIDEFDKPYWIKHPDWHSASWLTLEEFEKAVELASVAEEDYGVPDEYRAIVAYMKALNVPTRVVFWFDN